MEKNIKQNDEREEKEEGKSKFEWEMLEGTTRKLLLCFCFMCA
jgi:hypothetical protein